MESYQNNRRKKNFWKDTNNNYYNKDTISNNINHTNINNNINITNYYPTSSKDYSDNDTFSFINDGGLHNAINYKIRTTTHETNNIKDCSPIQTVYEKKYNQMQSPYMRKILPSTKRQQSEDGNRFSYVYKNSNSSTSKNLKSIKKNKTKNSFYYENISNKNQNKKNIKQSNPKNYYLDLSGDDLNNKYRSNRNFNYNNNFFYNNLDMSKTKILNNRSQINSSSVNSMNISNMNKSILSNESSGKETLFNLLEKPLQIAKVKKVPLYKIANYDKNNLMSLKLNSPKYIKSHKNLGIKNEKRSSAANKLIQNIILIQSVAKGYLFRMRWKQFFTFYKRVKRSIIILQKILFQKKKLAFYIFNNNIINNFTKYYIYSYLTPTNHMSLEFNNLKQRNIKIQSKESLNKKDCNKISLDDKDKYKFQFAEIQKELNKKKIDYAVAEKKIKELLSDIKKIQNINNIIVKDNKQLALKLKNLENNRYNKLEIRKTSFSYINSNSNSYSNFNIYKESKIKNRIDNILKRIIMKKIITTNKLLYKYFYKFYSNSKIICYMNNMYKANSMNNMNNMISMNNIKRINRLNKNIKSRQELIIEKNNFIINEKNNIQKKQIDYRDVINFEKSKKLFMILYKIDLNLYNYRNLFEKWMLRSLIFKTKDFVKEKKKRKKEKFRQKKQKKLFGSCLDKNDKKSNDDEIDNSMDSEDYENEFKYKNRYKSNSSKRRNNFGYDYNK